MTPSHRVSRTMARAASTVVTPPFPKTGTETEDFTSAMTESLAAPSYMASAVRACTTNMDAPAETTARATSTALRDDSVAPARSFALTGIFTARTMASITAAARDGSRMSATPESAPFAMRRIGQPMFTSSASAPSDSAIRAASAMSAGSPPKSCTTCGPGPGARSIRSALRPVTPPFTR
jgi:hypothetical protein